MESKKLSVNTSIYGFINYSSQSGFMFFFSDNIIIRKVLVGDSQRVVDEKVYMCSYSIFNYFK